MLLNILQCTGQPPTTKNYQALNVNSANVEKLYSRPMNCGQGEGQEGHRCFLKDT